MNVKREETIDSSGRAGIKDQLRPELIEHQFIKFQNVWEMPKVMNRKALAK